MGVYDRRVLKAHGVNMWTEIVCVVLILTSYCFVQETSERRRVGVTFSDYLHPNATKLMLVTAKKAMAGELGFPATTWEIHILTTSPKTSSQGKQLQTLANEFEATVWYVDALKNDIETKPYLKHMDFINLRPLIFQAWLRKNPAKLHHGRDQMYFADEDIAFNGSPFDVYTKYPTKSLFSFAERTNFTHKGGLNANYVSFSTHNKALIQHMEQIQVACSGVIVGDAWAMVSLFERMAATTIVHGFPRRANNAFTDQGTFNLLIAIGALDDLGHHQVVEEEDFVIHMTSHAGEGDMVQRMQRSRVVHQYKWIHSINAHFYKMYNLGTLDTSRTQRSWPWYRITF